MSRLPELSDGALSPEQRRIRDEIAAGPRGGARGPFPAMLRSPELAKRAAHLGEFLRFSTSLPPRLSELAILVTARAWTAQYEWYAHAKLALKGGLDATTVDATAERPDPPFPTEDRRHSQDFSPS